MSISANSTNDEDPRGDVCSTGIFFLACDRRCAYFSSFQALVLGNGHHDVIDDSPSVLADASRVHASGRRVVALDVREIGSFLHDRHRCTSRASAGFSVVS